MKPFYFRALRRQNEMKIKKNRCIEIDFLTKRHTFLRNHLALMGLKLFYFVFFYELNTSADTIWCYFI